MMELDKLGVTLAPMDEQSIDAFEETLRSEEGTGVFQWFGFTGTTQLRTRMAEDGLIAADGGMLAILQDGRSVGRVEWFASYWGRPATSSCWTIAMGITAAHRGNGVGSEALALVTQYLFEHTRAERIQAFTDVENIASRRALDKAGFEEEGIVRRAQWRASRWHDVALYAKLRASK